MKLYIENGQTIPAVQVLPDADPAPVGFTLVTGITEVAKYGPKVISQNVAGWGDRLCLRSKLKVMIYTKMGVAVAADLENQTKWDLLTLAEKVIACEYFIVGKESFLLGVNNDLRYWTIAAGQYRAWTMQVRGQRAELAESILFMRLQNVSDAKQALADLSQISVDTYMDIDNISKTLTNKVRVKKLNTQYIEGIEDVANDGVVAVRDWIKSTVGTPYENNGFMSLTYPFKGSHTSASVRDEMIAALDGTY